MFSSAGGPTGRRAAYHPLVLRRVAEPFDGTPLEVGAPSFAHFAKGGRQTDGTMGFAFYATRTGNEIFFHPSFTRTGPDSSRK